MIAASVIVPAHDAAATLGKTLRALAAQRSGAEFEVIVVDDGSSDETAAIAEAAPGVRLVRERGVGPGPARNAGAAVASGAVLAFTDADCEPTPGWLEAGLGALAHADLVQGAVCADPSVPQGPFDRTVWVTGESGLYECASLFITRAAFDRVGGFEDWLGATIGKPLAEDAWLGWRLRRAGLTTAFSADALVHHAVFARGPREFVAERRRLVYFPAIARKMPELRAVMFFARVFLSRRTAGFDAALAGAATAAAARSRLPLAAALPWLWMLARRALPWRRRAPQVFAAEAAADAVGAAALAMGSVRARTPVL